MKLLRMGKGTKQLCAAQTRSADMLQAGDYHGKSLHEIKAIYVCIEVHNSKAESSHGY